MFKKKIGLAMALILVGVMLSGCFGGRTAWVDTSVTKVTGITVNADKEVKTKAFVQGTDSEVRVQKFGELGSISLINVKIMGTVVKSSANNVVTPITVDGESSHVTMVDESVTYYTDYIKLKIKLPENATKIDTLDGDGAVAIDMTESVEDGYYETKLEWLKVDVSKENYTIAGDATTKDEYYYFGFKDDDGDLVKDYFVCILYEVTFS